MADMYEALGVSRDASSTEIKVAFHKQAKAYHPDLKAGDEERFKAITQAYDVLGKADARAAYDAECALEQARKRRQMQTTVVIMAASFLVTVGTGLLIAGWLRIEGIL